MYNIMNKKAVFLSSYTLALCLTIALVLTVINTASAATLPRTDTLSLQNLERERAALVQDLLSPALDLQQRQQKLTKRQRQLTDMERMVMRDERLLASNSALVKNAFKQYDLTFLVHAGAEKKRSASQQWLASVNVTNSAVLATKVGFRK